MNKESIKSLILSFLLFLSLILTWALWTYQPQSGLIQNTDYMHNIEIGNKKDLDEVITPFKVIMHHNQRYYGVINQKDVATIFNEIKWFDFSDHKKFLTFDGPLNQVLDNDLIEVVFPTAIPTKTLSEILDLSIEKGGIQSVDRIVIPLDQESMGEIYFISLNEQQVGTLMVGVDTLKTFKNNLFKPEQYPAYFAFKVHDLMNIYLPEKSLELDQLTYSTKRIPISKLKYALFQNPNLVKQYSSNNGEESYTDGASALEVFYFYNKMRYINPTKEIYDLKADEVIENSVRFLNDHAGWTDEYFLYDWSLNKQSTEFRLFVEGIPVFDHEGLYDLSTIYQSWRKNEVYEYSRSLINLQFSIDIERKTVRLPSGHMLITMLKNQKSNFNPALIEQVTMGYEMVQKNENAAVVTFEPQWFILYDGRWETVDLPHQGGNVIGLE